MFKIIDLFCGAGGTSIGDQKKFIGNAVVPDVVEAWICAYYKEITNPQLSQLKMFG